MTQKLSGTMLRDGAITEAETGFTPNNYVRVGADGTLEERTPAETRSDIGAGTGSGSVTSVNITSTTGLTASGGPITTSGSLTYTLDGTLQALAGANWAANSLAIGSGADTVAQVTFGANTFPGRGSTGNLVAKPITDAALALLDDADAATMRTTLGIPTLDSGTYTPTLTPVSNVDSAVQASFFFYSRVGDIVTVSGGITIDNTAATTVSELGISLPIASNFTAFGQCSGVGASGAAQSLSGAISGDATNDRARLNWTSGSTTDARAWNVTFQYRVLA